MRTHSPRAPFSAAPATLPGRSAEIKLIKRELDLASEGEARFVVLVGEAGVGKTRLLHEMARQADMHAIGLRALPEHLGPDDLLVHWLTPLLAGPLPMAARRGLALAAKFYPHLSELGPIVASQLSPADSTSVARARAAVARLIADVAERRPLLFILDDLPCFRAETRELIIDLAVGLADAPLAFLATARLEGRKDPISDRTFGALLGHHLLRRVDIRPLDREGLTELAAGELDWEIVPAILPWLYERSRGNALFALELLRSLQAHGVLRFDSSKSRWQIHGPLTDLPVPQSIAHALEVRRGNLPPQVARSLPAIAFLGPDVPIPLLGASLGISGAKVEAILKELVEAGVLQHCDSRHAFVHPLMLEHWSTILEITTRTQIAQKAISQMLGQISKRTGSMPGFVTGSCATGLEAANPDEIARLLAYADPAGQPEVFAVAAIESGRRSLAGRRVREAASWTRRTTRRLRQLRDAESRRWLSVQLDDLMGKALYFAGRFGAAEYRLKRFVLAPEAMDPDRAPSAFTYLGLLRQKSHRHEEAKQSFLAGLETFGSARLRSPQDLVIRAGFLNHLAWNELQRNEVAEAERFIEQTTGLLEDPPPEAARAVVQLLHSRSSVSAARGDFCQSIAGRERVLELSRHHVPSAVGSASINLARLLAMTGELQRARRLAMEAIHIHTRNEDRGSLSTGWLCLGLIEYAAAEWVASRQAFEEAQRLAELIGNQIRRFGAILGLMACHEALGNRSASDNVWIAALALTHSGLRLPVGEHFELYIERIAALCRRRDWEAALDVAAKIPRPYCPNNPPRDLAALEILTVRAELGRMRSQHPCPPASSIAPSIHEQVEHLAHRLDAHEDYLRKQNLRCDLVNLARVRLHLHLAGWRPSRADELLAEIEEHVMVMGATAHLTEIAKEFTDTVIADLPRYRSVFLPAQTGSTRDSGTTIGETTSLRSAAGYATFTHGLGTSPVSIVLPGQGETNRSLRIQVFGTLRVIRSGENTPINRHIWGSRKARVLLAYLLAQDPLGKGLSRNALCEAIWPEMDSLRPENTFHVTLTRLRKALGGTCHRESGELQTRHLRFEDGRYSLDFNELWCDAREFEEDLRRAAELERRGSREEATSFRRQAFELYDGEFLADFDEVWTEPRREHYRTKFLQLGFDLTQEEINQHRFDHAQDIAERLVSAEPLAEESHRLLIRVHLAAGRRDAAVRQLDRCRNILAEHLGLELSEETRRIFVLL
jgi:two-component SAPR family response regulator